MSDRKIILIGGGGHCRSCIDVIEVCNEFKIAGIVEKPGDKAQTILGYPVIGSDDDLKRLKLKYDYAFISIGQVGSSTLRQKIFNRLKKLEYTLPVIVSPLAHVSKHARIGEASVIMHQAIVNAGADIGKNCILNTRCLIEHDVKIGAHTHVSTAAVINGQAVIGSGSFVGSNATIVQGAKLLDHYFFKAGSLVTGKMNGNPIQNR